MATVTLRIGDLSHQIACRDGGEARLQQAAALIDEQWETARRASGGNAQRTMLLAALMVADALIEAREAPPPETPTDVALGAIAERLEALATTLEQTGATH